MKCTNFRVKVEGKEIDLLDETIAYKQLKAIITNNERECTLTISNDIFAFEIPMKDLIKLFK